MIVDTDQRSLTVSHATITADALLPAHHQQATSITLENCTSNEWSSVGKALASLPQLKTLVLLRCDAGDILCKELAVNQSLLQLRIGKDLLTQNIVD